MTASEQKITFGEMRASGVRNVLVYCRDHRCSHSIEVSADRWPDHVRLSNIEPGFVCTRCGKHGAEVRPKSSQAGATSALPSTTDMPASSCGVRKARRHSKKERAGTFWGQQPF